eukprot:jgi/Tetstr1/460361/TSEL_005660.t1
MPSISCAQTLLLVFLVSQGIRVRVSACGRGRAHAAEELAMQRYKRESASRQGGRAQVAAASGTPSAAAAPLRVHPEYQLSGLDSARSQLLRQVLIPAAVGEISQRLLVRDPVVGNLTLDRGCGTRISEYSFDLAEDSTECSATSIHRYCSDEETGVLHNPDLFGSADGVPAGSGAPDADIILYVATTDVPECWQGTIAYAGACEMDALSGRPLAGSNLFDIGYGNQFQAADGRQVEVVREVDSPSTSQSRHVVVLPDVVAVAAAHFGCPSLDGVELSNDELQPGNHWEDRIYSGELMDSARRVRTSADHAVFSTLTIAMAEASGWYLRNPAAVQASLPIGHRAGCEAVMEDTCRTPASAAGGGAGLYCSTLGRSACTYSHLATGSCAMEAIMDGCHTVVPLTAADDCRDAKMDMFSTGYHGPGGRCIPWQQGSAGGLPSAVSGAQCFRARCESGILYVQVDGREHACATGRTISIQRGNGAGADTLGPCPDNSQLCNSLGCDADCNGRGNCAAGVCQCYLGWAGPSCERRSQALRVFEVKLPAAGTNQDESDGRQVSGSTLLHAHWVAVLLAVIPFVLGQGRAV